MFKSLKAVRMNQSGFTLVELMIVVAIIGILAAIAIPNFQKYQAKARQKESTLMLASAYTAQISFRGEYNSFTGCLKAAGFSPEENLKRFYTVGFSQANAVGATNCGPTGALACNINFNDPSGTALCTPNNLNFSAAFTNATVGFPANATIGLPGHTGWNNLLRTQALGGATGAAPVLTPAQSISANAFIIEARGNVTNVGGAAPAARDIDVWRIDQDKNLYNANPGI